MSELDLSTPYATWVYLNRVVEGPSAALQALLTQYQLRKSPTESTIAPTG